MEQLAAEGFVVRVVLEAELRVAKALHFREEGIDHRSEPRVERRDQLRRRDDEGEQRSANEVSVDF
jgi:hypothetical protein